MGAKAWPGPGEGEDMGGSFSHLTTPAVAGCASWCWNGMRELCASLNTASPRCHHQLPTRPHRSWPEHVSDRACFHGRATLCRKKLTQAALSLGANRFALLAETKVLGLRSQAAACMGGGLAP